MAATTTIRPDRAAAVIWVEPWHARVAVSHAGRQTVIDLDRDSDPEVEFLRHVAREAADCDRLVVMGADDARLAFEREYVAIYKRPDRLIDVEAAASATTTDLIDRLRVLDQLVDAAI